MWHINVMVTGGPFLIIICVLAYLIEIFHSYRDYTYRLNICTLAQLDDSVDFYIIDVASG